MSSFAREVGLSPAAVRKYKKEGSVPRADIAVRIAKAANVEIAWLLTGEGPMRRSEIKGIPVDVAEAAAVGLAASYRTSPHKLDNDTLLLTYRDFCRGFTEAAETDD